MKLALDHRYSTRIAIQLRERARDVIAAVERGWERPPDEPLLALIIARRWALEGRHHYGLAFTSDSSLPRTRNTIGRYVDALARVLDSSPVESALVDRVLWL